MRLAGVKIHGALVHGHGANPITPIVRFDKEYKIGSIIVVPAENQKYSYAYSRIWYSDEEAGSITSQNHKSIGTGKTNVFERKTDANGKIYYEIVFAEGIDAREIQVAFSNDLAYGDGRISIAEMKFYEYNSLESEIEALFNNESDNSGLRIELSQKMKDVIKSEGKAGAHSEVQKLRDRANAVDEVSNEKHPRLNTIMQDLEYIDKLIDEIADTKIITVDQNVSNKADGYLGFSYTLSDLQPLGIVAKPGNSEINGSVTKNSIIVYVGATGYAKNATVPLEVVFTQYHPEYSNWRTTTAKLKNGRNVIEIPKVGTVADNEEARWKCIY